MAGALNKPRVKSFWLLVRRLLCRKNCRPRAAAAEEDGEKGSLLSRSSLEELLESDDGAEDGGSAVCRFASQYCAKKDGQPVLLPGLQRPEATAVSAGGQRPEAAAVSAGGDRDGAVVHRRFMFGGFRRRLLMRRPWRPMLVAIPE